MWWLACVDGAPVSSLVCYPLAFAYRGEVLPGYGLGAVATHPEHRRRGHATALCAAVCDAAEAEGRRIGALFSAIAPALYERLGFRVAPAEGSVSTRLRELAESGPTADLTPIDPRRQLPRLSARYREFHGDALHFARDEAAWHRTFAVSPRDLFFSVGDAGYVRVSTEDEEVEILELVVSGGEVAPVLRAVATLTLGVGHDRLLGWWSPPAAVADLFEPLSRAENLPMIRGEADLAGFRVWGSEYF